MTSRSDGSPRGRETRSPVITTSSGLRDVTHSTARSTACVPRDGSPRWKSDRCAMRNPASSEGSRASGTSSVRSLTQPASNHPQPTAAPAAPPNKVPARDLVEIIAPETAPPKVDRCRSALVLADDEASDFELLEHGRYRDDMALELPLGLLEPRRHADQLREVQ